MKRRCSHGMTTVWAGIALAIVLGSIEFADGKTITVGPEGAYDCDTIQAGIDAASDGDTVLAAPGEYIITEPVTFRGKAITVRSEAGRGETTIRMGTPADPKRASVVVFENNEAATSVLEGFTITEGRGCWVAGAGGWVGGGIYFLASSATVRDCTIVQNNAGNGGGVVCEAPCSPILIDCTIAENSAEENVGGLYAVLGASVTLANCIISRNASTQYAGGASCWEGSALILTNCIIAENSAGLTAGGVMSANGPLGSSVTMTDCIVTGNTAVAGVGGGIHFAKGIATVTNCIITLNTAAMGGGGVGCAGSDSFLSIRNCTIWGNSSGGSNYNGGGVGCFLDSSAEVTNSIIWGNASPRGDQIAVTQGASTLTVIYSNVAGGQAKAHVDSGCTLNWGEGNIDAAPCFADLGYWADVNDPNIVVEPDDPNVMWIDGDYHLKSEAGRWDPYSEGWVMDDVTSPCIDRGDPNGPVGEEPDPNGGIINMGAYGGTPEASMSIGMLPPLPPLAHWKLDEAEGHIAYDGVGGNDGVLVGDPIWWPEGGAVDGALELDGTDDVVVADLVLDPADGPLSVFAWVNGGAPGQVVISQVDGENWLCTDPANGCLMTELKGTGRFSSTLCSETIITDGDWHRVGMVWEDESRTLYVDDIMVAQDMQAGGPTGCSGDLNIGCGADQSPESFFSGLIDDVRIYNRAVRP